MPPPSSSSCPSASASTRRCTDCCPGYGERRFGGAREALGATVTIGDVAYVIVGVMPPGFSGPDPDATDVWLPLQIAAPNDYERWPESNLWSLGPLVRLAPGVTAGAAAAATGRLRAARAGSPRKDPEAVVVLGPLLKTRGPAALAGDMRLPLVVVGVALAVLLIAVANVSNLLMLRVAARRRELAVRHALGAGRWGVGRLLVTESVVLAAVSGVAALGVAAVTGRLLRVTLLPGHRWEPGPFDFTAIGFTVATVLAVGFAAATAAGRVRRAEPEPDEARRPAGRPRPGRAGAHRPDRRAGGPDAGAARRHGHVPSFVRGGAPGRRGLCLGEPADGGAGGWNEPPIIEGRVDALEARVRSLARRAGRGAGDQRAAEDGLGAGRSCARRASTGFPA